MHSATAPDRPAAYNAPFPTDLVTLAWQEQARPLVGANRLNALAGPNLRGAECSARDPDAAKGVPTDVTLPSEGYGAGGRGLFEASRGAVAGASAQVLSWFFPAAAGALEQKLADQGSSRAASALAEPPAMN